MKDHELSNGNVAVNPKAKQATEDLVPPWAWSIKPLALAIHRAIYGGFY